MFDLLLHGGQVLDGTGANAQLLDVGITGDKISYVGRPLIAIEDGSDGSAARVIDLTGLVVAPGFIDIHTHSDLSLLSDQAGASKILQGVTTEVVGNCGFSAFPSTAPTSDALLDHLARLGGDRPSRCWPDLDAYVAALEEDAPSLNVVPLVGHGALRIAAMSDPFARATAADLERMSGLLSDALEKGAWGLSTGLTHTPSSLADEEEVVSLAVLCARHEALYATHARVLAGRSFAAIEEALRTSRRSGAKLEYSHLALHEPKDWGHTEEALALFETAAADGLDIGFDLYPYEASASDLMQYLPQWAQAGGSVGVAANNGDPVWRRRVLDDVQKGWFGGIPWLWDRVVITAAGPHVQEVGLSIEAISQLRGTPPEQVLLDLCAELGSAAQAVLHYRQDSDVTEFLGHPLAVIGSDGNAVSLEQNVGKPHPRGFGTFPRVLGRYVRQRGALTLANAVHKMTLAPAERLGLGRRGALRTGYWADVVVFNPETVIDRATFIEPRQPPVGIVYVFVNGSMVVNDGQLVPTGQGRVLRHG